MLSTFVKRLLKKRNHRFNQNEVPVSMHYTSKVFHSNIGRYTYIGKECDLIKSQIGRYCSIAQNVKILPGTHPSSQFISSHPFFYSASNPVINDLGGNGIEKSLFDENRMVDGNYYVKIGNDVWIGANVTILSGITVGDGAIIGCGAVVTKDVQPYTIVGGVPAKYIKSRFKEEDIKFLIESKWWLFNHELIEKHILDFQNISLFKAFIEKNDAS